MLLRNNNIEENKKVFFVNLKFKMSLETTTTMMMIIISKQLTGIL